MKVRGKTLIQSLFPPPLPPSYRVDTMVMLVLSPSSRNTAHSSKRNPLLAITRVTRR